DAFHRRNRGEPAGGTAGAEADDERALRRGIQNRSQHAEHDRRGGIAEGAAVGLAVDDERVAGGVARQRDAAFDAVAFPDDDAVTRPRPGDPLIRRREGPDGSPSGADRAVTP